MINEKRVRLMTKLADFEERNHNLVKEAGTYFRSDYISVRLLKNFLRITFVYLIGIALWACYSMDELMEKLNTMDVVGLGIRIMVLYGVVVAVYMAVTYVISTIHFYGAEKKLQTYRNMLDRLILEYDGEQQRHRGRRNRERERRRNLGGTVNDSTRGI